MTVGQLKKELDKYPDNMDVFLAGGKTEFAYGLLNTVKQQEIRFTESPDDGDDADPISYDNVVILDEE